MSDAFLRFSRKSELLQHKGVSLNKESEDDALVISSTASDAGDTKLSVRTRRKWSHPVQSNPSLEVPAQSSATWKPIVQSKVQRQEWRPEGERKASPWCTFYTASLGLCVWHGLKLQFRVSILVPELFPELWAQHRGCLAGLEWADQQLGGVQGRRQLRHQQQLQSR